MATKTLTIIFGMAANLIVAGATPAKALGPCPLCNLGFVVQGFDQEQARQQQVLPPPVYVPQYYPPPIQYHTYQLPGGTLNCSTMLQGTPSATTTCR